MRLQFPWEFKGTDMDWNDFRGDDVGFNPRCLPVLKNPVKVKGETDDEVVMKIIKTFLSVVVLSVLAGCATVKQETPKYVTGEHPEIGVENSVYVGQVMVSEYDYLSQDTAVLRGNVDGNLWLGRQGVSNGANLIGAIAGGEKIYCVPPGGYGMPCLKDTNSDGSFDRAYTMNAFGMVVNGIDISPVRYKQRDSNIQDGFKYELVYQGVSDRTIKITYREYRDNLARPAFRQDLSYNFDGEGTQIRFRDVSMVVKHADNNEIVYVVNSGF